MRQKNITLAFCLWKPGLKHSFSHEGKHRVVLTIWATTNRKKPTTHKGRLLRCVTGGAEETFGI